MPLFVKETFHWSSTAAGLIFFCVFIPGFFSPLVGMLSDRVGARWPTLGGFLATLPLLVCMRFVTDDSTAHKVLLCALLALLGTSTTFCNVPLMAEITYSIEAKAERNPGVWGDKGVYGIGYGLYTTAFALGGTIGSFMAGYVNAGRGWSTMTWALAVWCAGGVVVSFWVGGAKPASKPRRRRGDRGSGDDGDRDGGGGPGGSSSSRSRDTAAGVVVSGGQGGE